MPPPLANDLVSELILADGGYCRGRDGGPGGSGDRAAHGEAGRNLAFTVREVQRYLGTTVDDVAGESALTSAVVERYLTSLGMRDDRLRVKATTR